MGQRRPKTSPPIPAGDERIYIAGVGMNAMWPNRDYLVDKLEEKERGEEDTFFAAQDRALVEKAHQDRDLMAMRCPDCGARLKAVSHCGVLIEQCLSGHGMWLTDEELHTVAKRERDSWLRRYLYWLHA